MIAWTVKPKGTDKTWVCAMLGMSGLGQVWQAFEFNKEIVVTYTQRRGVIEVKHVDGKGEHLFDRFSWLG